MIPKNELVDGAVYEGHCRNSSTAKWNVMLLKFIYMRTKFNMTFEEEIVHAEDDEGFDIFVPVRIID